MSPESDFTTAPEAEVSTAPPSSLKVGATTVLLIGAGVGLIAGYCDLAVLILYKRVISHDFYHLGDDFPWLVPLGVMGLVLVPAIALALWARIRGPITLGIPVAVLTFVACLDVCARIRLESWATLIICLALAVQSIRSLRTREAGFLWMVRRSTGVLIGIALATMLWQAGGQMWADYRQRSNLPPPATGARNVLLIVWDTVRADHTSLHGYSRPTTPNLDRLAGQGVRFDQAYATAPWTLASHASLFTGRWPHELGVDWKTPMRGDRPTLAEFLASHGYDTAGFVANIDYCSREMGLARGFAHYEDFALSVLETFRSYVALGRRLEHTAWASTAIDAWVERYTGRWYDFSPRSKEHTKDAGSINDSFMSWLGKRPRDERPFFAFLNYNDAHSPYEVPDPAAPAYGLRPKSAADRERMKDFSSLDKKTLTVDDVRMATDVYDDSIAHLDRKLGTLLDELDRRGILENTVVIVTADHGEHLGDHGLFFHGCSLYRQLVQVPLVIVGPERIPAGGRVPESICLADLPSTIVDVLGLGPRHPFMGQSLAAYWQPREVEQRIVSRPILMETTKPEILWNEGREPAAKGPMKSVIAAGMHYIQMADGAEELFDLSKDVEERDSLVRRADMIPVVLQMRNLLGLMLKKR